MNVVLRDEKHELLAEWRDYVPPIGTEIVIDRVIRDKNGNTIPNGIARQERVIVISHAPVIVIGLGYTYVNVFVYVRAQAIQ